MDTKILDDKKTSGSGTVILENNQGEEKVTGTGTVILENGSGEGTGSGTVLLDGGAAGAGGAGGAGGDGAAPEPVVPPVPGDVPAGQPSHLKGPQLASGVEVLGYKIKNQMNTNSAEADLFTAEKNGETFVLKYYRSSHKPKNAVVEIIKNLKNPHIVKLYDYGFYNERFFEVYEYAKGGNVSEKKKNGSYKYLPLNEEQVLKLCGDIVEAFKEFHDAGIIHRDIKPENFLLRNSDTMEIIIGDFGISSVMEEGEELHKTKTRSHTVGYVPREFLTADYKGIGTGLDYYSLGITLWEFATGESPFINKFTGLPRNERLIMRDTREGRIADDLLTREPKLSPKLQKLIRGLLVTDYTKRWGYSEVKRFLNGEEVEVAKNEVRKIKIRVLGQLFEDEQKLAVALWNKRDDVKYPEFSKVADEFADFFSDDDDFINKLQSIKDEITDPNDLQIPLLKLVYLINPEISFDIGDGYSISSKEDIIDVFENAPEMLVNCLKHQDSLSFTFVSMVLGEEVSKKLKAMIKTETERNRKYFNMTDHLYNLKLVTKTKLILKKEIQDEVLKPFTAEEYKPIALRELSDLMNLNSELKENIMEAVRENCYEGDIVPWLELQTGKRIEEFAPAARDKDWNKFYTSLCEGQK